MAELHFLLLEDDPLDVELVSTTLKNSNLDCDFTVVDTQVAFESALKSQPFDLVFADYSLPTFDGMSAINFVARHFPSIPCILISGVLGEDRAIEALKSGAADYVLKQRLERLAPATKRALREYSERKALAQATARLKESEVRFRTSVETMADPLAVLSAVRNANSSIEDFIVDHLNKAACQYLSVALEQQIGKSLYEAIPALKQPKNHSLFDAFCGVVDTGRSSYQEATVKGMRVADKGEQQQVVLDIRAAKLNDGLVITWRDITQRRKIEQQRLELLSEAEIARNQAEEANQFKDVFLAHLSHELRSPLSAIKGWLQIVMRPSSAPKVLSKALKSMARNADLLESLIGDLLENARIEQGQFSFNPKPLSIQDFSTLVEASVEAMMPKAQAKEVTVKFLPDCVPPEMETERVLQSDSWRETGEPGDEAYVMGDPARLEQVIRNLLSNAIKFTPKKGKVKLSICKNDNSLDFTVKDTGIGMEADALQHIFERFWQSSKAIAGSRQNRKSANYETGLGLGLSIVLHIVESHGGKITVESEGTGKGSAFNVRLPLMSALSTDVATMRPTSSVSVRVNDSTSQSFQSKESSDNTYQNNTHQKGSDSGEVLNNISLEGSRIMIVEDYQDALDAYSIMLSSHGADVRGVRSAHEALEVFSNFKPHVLISDLGLPDESGYSLIRKIRTLPVSEGGDIPAVALTAFTEDTYCTRALLAGFHLHIAKPIDLNDMVVLVSKLRQ